MSRDTCDVTVMLDGDSQATLYRNVLSKSTDKTPELISDVTPGSDQVSVGSRFLVLLDSTRWS